MRLLDSEYFSKTGWLIDGRNHDSGTRCCSFSRLRRRAVGVRPVNQPPSFQNIVLKPSQIATMEEFIDNVRVVLSALGNKFLAPQPSATITTQTFKCVGRDADVKGFVSTNGFTVLQGSRIASTTVESFRIRARGYYDLRKRLEADGTIVDCKFIHNFEFSSPSSASAVVLGRNSNGNQDWRASDGRTLGDIQQ